jgi:hypothetical protein
VCFPCDASPRTHNPPPAPPLFVPLDSWVYSAFYRLGAIGYSPDLDTLIRPWSRSECVTLLREAEDLVARRSMKDRSVTANVEAKRLLAALHLEFQKDMNPVRAQFAIESVYSQIVPIAGSPINDSYHLGQTIVNNYGRPFGEGFNSATGFSAYATFNRFSAYFRGEEQTSGANGAYGDNLSHVLASADGTPTFTQRNVAAIRQFQPLEMYVGMRLGNFNVTFGKQSSWWGPGVNSAFAFSNNSDPMYSLKISQQTPWVLPGVLHYLGHIRTEFLLGRFSGNQSPPRPFLNAQKITFQVTPTFEIGFTRSSIFGGVGHPLTAGNFFQSFFSTSSTGGDSFGSHSDPGDRRSGFDFSWRPPGISRWMTIYSDSMADDEPNPLASPRRSAWAPGVYFPSLVLPKLDLRFETYSTWLYRGDAGGRFLYWNTQYRDAYTNNGNIVGSWVGRDARAYLVSSSYWLSSTRRITAEYKQVKTGSQFLLGGGTQTDVSIRAQWAFSPNILGDFLGACERVYIPMLGPARTIGVARIALTYYPRNRLIHH